MEEHLHQEHLLSLCSWKEFKAAESSGGMCVGGGQLQRCLGQALGTDSSPQFFPTEVFDPPPIGAVSGSHWELRSRIPFFERKGLGCPPSVLKFCL